MKKKVKVMIQLVSEQQTESVRLRRKVATVHVQYMYEFSVFVFLGIVFLRAAIPS